MAGTLGHKQLAALIGDAPLNRDSGRWRGQRTVWGGHGHVRAGLYMATTRAVRCHSALKALYERLIRLGKHRKTGASGLHAQTAAHLQCRGRSPTRTEERAVLRVQTVASPTRER